MNTKIALVIAVIFALIFPTGIALVGYLMLTSHLQGAAAAILGWILFIGGFLATIPAGAAVAEIHSPQASNR